MKQQTFLLSADLKLWPYFFPLCSEHFKRVFVSSSYCEAVYCSKIKNRSIDHYLLIQQVAVF